VFGAGEADFEALDFSGPDFPFGFGDASQSRVRRHGDDRLSARKDSAGPVFRSAGSVRSGARG